MTSSPKERFWRHKLSEAQTEHDRERRRMNEPGGASLRSLERLSRQIARAKRELARLKVRS